MEVLSTPLRSNSSFSIENSTLLHLERIKYSPSKSPNRTKPLPIVTSPSIKPRISILSSQSNLPLKQPSEIISKGDFSPAINKSSNFPYGSTEGALCEVNKKVQKSLISTPDVKKDPKQLFSKLEITPIEYNITQELNMKSIDEKLIQQEQKSNEIDSKIEKILLEIEKQTQQKEQLKDILHQKLELEQIHTEAIENLENILQENYITDDIQEEFLQLPEKQEEEYEKFLKFFFFFSIVMFLFLIFLFGIFWLSLWSQGSCSFWDIGNFLWRGILDGLNDYDIIMMKSICYPKWRFDFVPT